MRLGSIEFCTGLKGLFEHSLSIAIAAVLPAHFYFRIHSAPRMEFMALLDRLKTPVESEWYFRTPDFSEVVL